MRDTIVTAYEKITNVSELQRSMKRVLDDAGKGPVCLVRPKAPAITLVARERWCEAAQAMRWLEVFTAVVRYAIERVAGGDAAAYPVEFAWLRKFDIEDVREFLDEFSTALHGALQGGRSWDAVDAVVEEWRRSAAVLGDDDLPQRFRRTLDDLNA